MSADGSMIMREANQSKSYSFFKNLTPDKFEEVLDVAMSNDKIYVIDENNQINLVTS